MPHMRDGWISFANIRTHASGSRGHLEQRLLTARWVSQPRLCARREVDQRMARFPNRNALDLRSRQSGVPPIISMFPPVPRLPHARLRGLIWLTSYVAVRHQALEEPASFQVWQLRLLGIHLLRLWACWDSSPLRLFQEMAGSSWRILLAESVGTRNPLPPL